LKLNGSGSSPNAKEVNRGTAKTRSINTMDATVDRILMSRSGKDVHCRFSHHIFGKKK